MNPVLYSSAGIPAMQNRLYSSQADAMAAPSADIELSWHDTGFVFNRRFDPGLVVYDKNYQNDQGYSVHFLQHLDQVSSLCKEYLPSNECLIVDVGCGKGGFVELLRSKGLNAVGYDNAYEGEIFYIRKQFFGSDSHEKGDLLILRHVLEHIPSPWEFLNMLADANQYKGRLYIEVPDLLWILENHAFFDIFHEHVNYFQASDFIRRFGDAIVHSSTSFGGQYLSIVIDLSGIKHESPTLKVGDSCPDILMSFDRLSEFEQITYASFSRESNIVLWGAGAKGVVFASKAPLEIRKKILYAIDINPSKHGSYMPISGIEVIDHSSGVESLKPSSHVIIMNPNYEKEIRSLLPSNQPCSALH
jgi:SAM-dependent methyltransferase